jgi:hypothetical protein
MMMRLLALVCLVSMTMAAVGESPWKRHHIDASGKGADGVRLGDCNGDGLPDIVVPWEQSGEIRIYLNPGPAKVGLGENWTIITVGNVVSPEDAVPVDLDGDGAVDVVSACEGTEKLLYVHWAPSDPAAYTDASAWTTRPIPDSRNKMAWMFTAPADIDGRRGVDLFAGGKDRNAMIGWYESPKDPRALEQWTWHHLCPAGWVMSLQPYDFDGDEDMDLLVTDRRGNGRGAFWLEHPGDTSQAWNRINLGAREVAPMFLTRKQDVVLAATEEQALIVMENGTEERIVFPENTGTGKGVAIGDLDGDGIDEWVVSCEHAMGKTGVFWMTREKSGIIADAAGTKFDRIELIDLDMDGDLDVLTTEEAEGLGVIWYENPFREPMSLDTEQVTIFFEEGRFGGWPANFGIWNWGDEILVGFARGWYKNLGERHHIDRSKPEEHLLARSLDGGKSWSIENPAEGGVLLPMGKGALHGTELPDVTLPELKDLQEPINFTHPDFAMTLRMDNIDGGVSRFYYSYDRGHTWNGPFRLPKFDTKGIAARTDYIVLGERDCMLFLTSAKEDGTEGKLFCARTQDGGVNWEFVSFIGPEPEEGFLIMPASAHLGGEELYVVGRRRMGDKRWFQAFRSLDLGKTWTQEADPVTDLGIGNPPAMVKLQDGRLCLAYGYRGEPYHIGAKISSDGGRTWSKEILLRAGGGAQDIGYPRMVQRPDGTLVTIYYFMDPLRGPERFIEATLWTPPAP